MTQTQMTGLDRARARLAAAEVALAEYDRYGAELTQIYAQAQAQQTPEGDVKAVAALAALRNWRDNAELRRAVLQHDIAEAKADIQRLEAQAAELEAEAARLEAQAARDGAKGARLLALLVEAGDLVQQLDGMYDPRGLTFLQARTIANNAAGAGDRAARTRARLALLGG